MYDGMFTMIENEELFVLQDEYEINGCPYLYYAKWNHGFTDCRKLLVNITGGNTCQNMKKAIKITLHGSLLVSY